MRQLKRQEKNETYDPICLSDMESDDEWIIESEDPCLPEDNSWMDVHECFQLDESASSSKKRKRGPRDLNAIKKGKAKVVEIDDGIEVVDDEEMEEDEETEMVEVEEDDDDEDLDLGDNDD
ncbi:unnamed protein product [Ilex paraguariensis]|uniref:Uncharacterized protein n=1 Tax=Ilex paraguariensis TaxID=185542 RepID=A0ABC8U7Y4_9AQUA